MEYYKFSLLVMIGLFCACTQKSHLPLPENRISNFQNKAHQLVHTMTQKTGGYQQLLALKDVEYRYIYRTPDGKEDVSLEKYIFDGELSLGLYSKHERTLPELDGKMKQVYDGTSFYLYHNEQQLTDPKLLEAVAFTRKTNFYWFAMMQKLLDPGIIYKSLDKAVVDGTKYEVVEISFQSDNDQPSDIYHLYINPKTALVDQFLFTVVAKNVVDNPLLMKVKYEEVDGILVPSYRKYTRSNWKAEVLNNDAWIEEISTEIKFNNGFSKSQFQHPAGR